jgi:hypothetical protein
MMYAGQRSKLRVEQRDSQLHVEVLHVEALHVEALHVANPQPVAGAYCAELEVANSGDISCFAGKIAHKRNQAVNRGEMRC